MRRTLGRFLLLFGLLLSADVRADDVHRPLLVEVTDVPAADQAKGGRFDYSDYNRVALLSLVRNRALLLATRAEFTALQSAGYHAQLLLENDDPLVLYRRAFYGPDLKLAPVYHRYDDMIAQADELVRRFPDRIVRLQMGETTQYRRPIYAYRVSNHAREPQAKPGVLFDGCHHSDELMGGEIVFALLQKLVLEYGTNPEVTAWVDRCEIYLVPVVNVDGHNIVTSGRDPRWRKNARDVNGDGVAGVFPEGVDVNRGYDFNWAMGGTDVPTKDSFRGAHPFSEAENRAMRALADRKAFVLSISYHSQGEVIYYPWIWGTQPSPDDALLREIAAEIAGRIRTMDGTGTYAVSPGGPSSQSYAWLYGRRGDFDFIVETGKGTHVFAPEEVPGILQANLEGVRALMARTEGPGLAVHVTDARTGAPVRAEVWLPRIENETVDRRHTDAAFGRYWRLLAPGKYQLIISAPGYRTVVLPATDVAAHAWTPLEIRLEPDNSPSGT